MIKKITSLAPLLLLLPAVLLLLHALAAGNIVTLPHYSEYYLEALEVQVDELRIGLFSHPILAKSFLITQTIAAGHLALPDWQSWAVFAAMVAGLSFITTALTGVRGQWFYLVLSAMGALLFTAQFQFLYQQASFGSFAHILIPGLVLVLVLGVQQFFYERSFGFRWMLVGLPILIAGWYYLFGWDPTPQAPARFLALGVGSLVISTLLFAAYSGADLLLAVYRVLTHTESRTPTKNVGLNLSVFTTLFVLNTVLAFAKSRNYEVGILVMGPELVLLLNAIAGYWALQQKETLLSTVIGVWSNARFLHLGWAVSSIAFVAWVHISANDSLQRLLSDGITVLQLTATILTAAYVFVNFGGLFGQLPNLYKVVYKPTRMPVWIIWLVVGLAGFAFFKAESNNPWDQYIAGKYAGQGLVAASLGDNGTAAEFFRVANREDFKSQLGMLGFAITTGANGDAAKAMDILEKGLEHQASPQAYLMLAQAYRDANRPQDYLVATYGGRFDFPDDWRFSNNLALYYAEKRIVDSVQHYISLATQQAGSNAVITANLLSLQAKSMKEGLADANPFPDDMACQNNLLATANTRGKTVDNHSLLAYEQDSTMNQLSFSYLYNYGVNRLLSSDTVMGPILDFFALSPNPRELMQALREVRALGYQKLGLNAKALRLMHSMSEGGVVEDYRAQYGRTLLASGAGAGAAPMLQQAAMDNQHTDRLLFAELNAFTGDLRSAAALLRGYPLGKPLEAGNPILPDHVMEAWTATPAMLPELSQGGKVAFLMYRANELDASKQLTMASGLSDPAMKVLALASITGNLQGQDQLAAINLVNSTLQQDKLPAVIVAKVHSMWLSALAQQPALLQKTLASSPAPKAKLVVNTMGNNGASAMSRLAELTPLNEAVLARAVEELNSAKQQEAAYDLLLRYLEYIPEGHPLIDRLYVLQCYRLKVGSFALSYMKRLKAQLTAAQWQQLVQEMQAISPAFDGTIPEEVQ